MLNSKQLAIVAVAVVGLVAMRGQPEAPAVPEPLPMPAPCPGPGPCPEPKPAPDPAPKPKLPRRPWAEDQAALVSAGDCKCCPQCKCELKKCPCRVISGGRCSKSCECGPGELIEAKVNGKVSPDGQEIQIDLPGELHMKNTGGMGPRGPGSGAGLCVFTSIEHAAHWQNVPALIGFQKWMTSKPGGGYPEKVVKMIEAYCKDRNLPVPAYLQVEGKDLEILRLACKTGRMPAITYGVSPTGRYGGGRIAHMTNLVHAQGSVFAQLDNNFLDPKENAYEWMNEKEFLKAYTSGGGGGWAVILLDPAGPPPVPRNR